MLLTKHAKIVQWVDQRYKEISPIFDIEITAPASVGVVDFDYCVIAIKDYEMAKEIALMMLSMGVDAGKIVWK